MKPIIIYAEEKNGKIIITKEEMQRIVDEAYRQGKADGRQSAINPITVTPTFKPPYEITTCTNYSTNDKGEPI